MSLLYPSFLPNILHRIVANPWIYDLIQLLLGARYICHLIASQIPYLSSASIVLDLGGGTGTSKSLWRSDTAYICLDIEMHKLHGFKRKHPDGIALLSDATCSPIRSGIVDAVLCIAVAHHLSDDMLIQLINESARVLKSAGKFIFVDPIWKPQRWAQRLLWKLDRGNYPRTAEALLSALSQHYTITHWERFLVLHEYVLCAGAKRSRKNTES